MEVSIDRVLHRARSHLLESADTKVQTADRCLESIGNAAEMIAMSLRSDGKVLLCGNGGSAADCQHLATEFTSVMQKDFYRPGMPAIALTTDTSYLTGFSNDFGYERLFERQVQTLGKQGDVLIAISTSGESPSIVYAVKAAIDLGIRTIALTGSEGQLASIANLAIAVPSADTQLIQEAHIAIEHALCDLVECLLFDKAEQMEV